MVEDLRLLQNEVFPIFDRTPITKIVVEDVDRWWANLLKAPDAAEAQLRRLRDPQQAMGAAVRDRRYPIVVSNPCQVDPGNIPKSRPNATLEGVEALARQMPDRLKLLVFLAAWSGLRYSELVELRHRDIDLGSDLPLLRVERAYSRVDGKNLLDVPKSEAGKEAYASPTS